MNSSTLFKKSLVFSALLLMPVIFSGCGEQEQIIEDTQTQVKEVGVLKSLGGITVGNSTHLLEKATGSTIRLRSSLIDLDSEKYLTKKVEVRGTLTESEDGKQVMDVKSIDLAESDNDEESENAGSEKEYINASLGFKLTYMDNWQVKDDASSVSFLAPKIAKKAMNFSEEFEDSTDSNNDLSEAGEETQPEPEEYADPDQIIISRLSNTDKQSLEEFLDVPGDPNEQISSGYSQMKVGKDLLNGIKKQSPNLLEFDIYVLRGEYVYKLSFKGTNHADSSKHQNTYYTMVSTLQFIGINAPEENETNESEMPVPVYEADSYAETSANQSAEDDYNDEVLPVESDNPVFETVETSSGTISVATPTGNTADTSNYGIISQYIAQSINSIAPESSEADSWTASSFEFVDPNYVYVVYGDGSTSRRLLLTYNDDSDELSTGVVGYFVPGETTSWERVTGENPVESSEKVVVTIGDEGAEEQTTVKEGYRYFESLPYNFMAQYPSNWYYTGNSGSTDVLHHYGFSNQPVENGNELVNIDVISGSLPSGSPISVGGNSAVKVVDGNKISIYLQSNDGNIYKVHGDSGYETYIIDIASSIIQK